MKQKRSQSKLLITLITACFICASFGSLTSSFAAGEDDIAPTTPGTGASNPNQNTAERTAFDNAASVLSGKQARLGDELSTLPGPNIDFQDLLRLIITWSASLAASVAIFLLVLRSFQSISGTEDAHKALRSTLVKIVIGLALVFFSYQIVSLIMGLIWAT